MWHVDEGTLHAYLDDRERGESAGALDPDLRVRVAAHLAECDDCSARLLLAERQRARAGDILGAAVPAIETPPFEAVTPVTIPTRPRPATVSPRSRPAWMPLAWAASLVLAVGAGWMGSVLWRGGALSPAATRSLADQATEGGPADLSANALEDAGNQEQTLVRAPAAEGVAAQRQAPPAAVPSPSAESRLAVADALTREEQAVGAVTRPPGEGAAAGGVEEPAPAEKAAARAAEQPTRQAERALNAAAMRVSAAVPTPTQLAADQVSEVAQPVVEGYPGDAAVAWQDASREQAEQLLGDRLYLLIDAPIREIQTAPAARPPLVRIRQLAGQDTIELLQWPATQPGGLQAPVGGLAAAAAVAGDRPLSAGQTRYGNAFLRVPGTTHPVLLSAPTAADATSLVPRVRQARQPD